MALYTGFRTYLAVPGAPPHQGRQGLRQLPPTDFQSSSLGWSTELGDTCVNVSCRQGSNKDSHLSPVQAQSPGQQRHLVKSIHVSHRYARPKPQSKLVINVSIRMCIFNSPGLQTSLTSPTIFLPRWHCPGPAECLHGVPQVLTLTHSLLSRLVSVNVSAL